MDHCSRDLLYGRGGREVWRKVETRVLMGKAYGHGILYGEGRVKVKGEGEEGVRKSYKRGKNV